MEMTLSGSRPIPTLPRQLSAEPGGVSAPISTRAGPPADAAGQLDCRFSGSGWVLSIHPGRGREASATGSVVRSDRGNCAQQPVGPAKMVRNVRDDVGNHHEVTRLASGRD